MGENSQTKGGGVPIHRTFIASSSSFGLQMLSSSHPTTAHVLPWRRADGVPRIRLAHRPLAYMPHDVPLHLVDVLLQVGIVELVLLLAPAVEPDPGADDQGRQGDCDCEVDPELIGHNWVGA